MEWRRCRSIWKRKRKCDREKEGWGRNIGHKKKAEKTTEVLRVWEINHDKLPESTVEGEDRTDRDQVILLRTEKCHVV